METSAKPQEKPYPSLQTSPIENFLNNNGVHQLIQQPPLTPKSIFTSETNNPNPNPTTFIQADTSSFKQVVQILTGSSETAKQASRSTVDPLSKSAIPPIKNGLKKQGTKLYERRNSLKNMNISPLISGSFPNQNCGFSPRNKPEIVSPSMLNIPALVLSPVTPLIQDPFNKSSSSGNSNNSSPVEHKEREISEKKEFYLHPSPISTPRDSEPKLLPLFP